MSKVIFITGGSSGIGKAIGDFLHEKGFKVYGTSRNPQGYSDSSKFELIKMDVCDTESVQQAISEVIRKENRLDVLINNAGVGITGPVEETPDSEIHKAFNTNVYGPIRVIKAALPHMRSQGGGLVINITSIAGSMGLPYRGIYSATKSALEITTEALRMETKQFGIEMTNVAPGDFATNIAAGRYHAPEQADSPYREAYGATLRMMNEHVDGGEDPSVMAKVVHNIITSGNPKVRYKVGAFLQKFSVVLKHMLPQRMYERMLMNHYKLK